VCSDDELVKGELDLVRRIGLELNCGSARPPWPVPFGDDMAGLSAGADDLLWTADMLMDGVDFESNHHQWYDIGRKAMAVNLSDCAAMAAAPVAAIAAVALQDTLSMSDALALVRGARDCAARYGCPLVGGDTNSWAHPTVVSISVAARPEGKRKPILRSGARPRDRVYVTGKLGGSILGRHMTFEPRIDTALAISRELAPRAMIDISDGLSLDLWRVLEASGCGATLDGAALDAAVHADAVRLSKLDGKPPRDHALHDGEDYELIVFVPPDAPEEACRRLGLLPLGATTPEKSLILREGDGRRVEVEPRGWEHFR